MWGKIIEFGVVQILLPLLKDLAFMLFNMFKVRKIRKEIEEAQKKKAEDFKNAETPEQVKETFGQLGGSLTLFLGWMMILSLGSFLFLVSCAHQDITTPDDPQCSPIFVTKIDHDGVEWISTTESYCICRKYRMSRDYIGMVPGTQTWNEPIKECHKVVGWKPEAYGRKAAFWEKIRQAILQETSDQ